MAYRERRLALNISHVSPSARPSGVLPAATGRARVTRAAAAPRTHLGRGAQLGCELLNTARAPLLRGVVIQAPLEVQQTARTERRPRPRRRRRDGPPSRAMAAPTPCLARRRRRLRGAACLVLNLDVDVDPIIAVE